MLTSVQVKWLLDDLCVQLGFCLPPDDYMRLQKDPPSEPEGFTDAVFVAEGMDPSLADRQLFRRVRAMIRSAYLNAEQNGA